MLNFLNNINDQRWGKFKWIMGCAQNVATKIIKIFIYWYRKKNPQYIKREKKVRKYTDHNFCCVLFCFRWYLHKRDWKEMYQSVTDGYF